MVNTVKFSQFTTAPLMSANNEIVGLESGVNVQSVRFLSWTTATRPATPFNGLLGVNTDLQQYEWWDSVDGAWNQLNDTGDIAALIARLAAHTIGDGASMIGLQNQSNVTNKTVQDLANATFIAQTDNGTLQNAQFLGSLTTGIVKNTTATGVLSISAPLTSIDSLTTVANNLLYTTASNVYAVLAPVNRASLSTNSTGTPTWLALTDGQVVIGSTAGSPAAASLSPGSGITITPGSNTITIAAINSGTVTSISAGTGITLTPNPITSTGSVALTIPVVETSGGTGQTTYALGDTLYSSAANTLSKLAGNITTAKQYLSQTGTGAVSAAPAWATIDGGDITGAALTKTDDTNVTLTLGGTPTTALLRATSLTLGWTGQLSLTRGGTNASLTASNGGIVWSNATQLQILAGTATPSKMLLSGATATPSWSTSTIPSSAGATANKVLLSDGTNYVLSTPTFPNASATSGKIIISDGTNWIASTPTYPATAGTSGNVLTSDGTNWLSSTPTVVTSNTYTPTLTNVSNITSSTSAQFQYLRIGNIVTVSGVVSITSVGAGTINLGISLPVASTFSALTNCGGTISPPGNNATIGGAIQADTTNHRANAFGIAAGIATISWSIHFTYLII